MNQHLQNILDWLQQNNNLGAEEKERILKSLKNANRELEVTAFKLSSTEKVKRTTGVLLEETIEELEHKRKAVEIQNRELGIEASLERVRAVAMSMMKADELLNVCKALFTELKTLGFTELRNALINTFDDEHSFFYDYDYSDFSDGNIVTINYDSHPLVTTHVKKIRSATNAFAETVVEEAELASWKENRRKNGEPEDPRLENISAVYYYFYSTGISAIGISTLKSISEDQLAILKRFRNVFDLAYRRYIDITNAEAQAREAKIEAALESVRSASLAMHHSYQLKTVAAVMFKKLMELGLTLSGAFIFLFDRRTRNIQLWIATTTLSEPGEINIPFTPEISKNQIFKDLWNVIENGEQLFNRAYSGKEKNDYFRHVGEHNTFPQHLKDFHQKANSWITSITGEKHAALGFDSWDEQLATIENFQILKKFSKVFEQAYVRFLDLQKAEAQSRESQIELSLERLRAKTMAMHSSADVGATAAVMVEELNKLGIETIRCGIGIMHEPGDMEVWTISTDENNKTGIVIGWLDMNLHPLLHGAFESWRKKIETYSYELKDEDLLEYYNAINNYPGYPIHYDTANLPKQIHHNEFHFAEGTLFAFSLQQLTDEQRRIFKRFAGVFGQTYRRYLDLKRAESQAREAQIEAALERVRGRTLAMQKSDELAETSAVLFRQLINLGIEPNRLYISIMKDDEGETEFWITDEDGSKVSSAYTDNLNENASFKKMYEGWKEGKQSMIIDMQGKELKDYFQHLTSLGVSFKDGLKQKRRIQHIAYFNRGFIGMAAPDDQPGETIHLLERFAAVFNLTFTRFNDLKIGEAHALQAELDLIEIKAARKKAEETLNELQVTQNQLIQKEKMASLGELTAGIAHEIQNPLNFVNNFSEVSRELIEELKSQKSKLKSEEQDEILNDIDANLEKINHHGRRADAIVKGMLQHSRKSSGQKEPTDINALCDEYLRLSYHGLRAKDKNFNADFKTDFDKSFGKINIVPQDIGRVLLNLVNNAFYAVNDKLKAERLKLNAEYKPFVYIQTKKLNERIEIKVEDNGNGISQNIIDKIFQPFFTTKPTGQGTGLGLSLAYDIITKEHNGTIKVESNEGEGTRFIIQIPS